MFLKVMPIKMDRLQYDALVGLFVALALLRQQGRPSCMLKDFSDTFIGLGGAFEIISCADLLLHFLALEIRSVSSHSWVDCRLQI